MRYDRLSQEDFDAIVTGELTHYAIWLEDELVEIIAGYFCKLECKNDFERIVLRKDGLTFQSKIEIVRSMFPLFKDVAVAQELKSALNEIEQFKSLRNAFSHGLDETQNYNSIRSITISTINRAGKEKRIVVTPESHDKCMVEAERLLGMIKGLREKILS